MKEEDKKALLKNKLQVDLLGKLPLFMALTNLDFSEEIPSMKKEYKGAISIAKYQTNQYQTSGYHKPISKIV